MSSFILKRTTDGMYHLYFDTPSKEGFTKVAKAQKANFIKERNHKYVVLYDINATTKTLYGAKDDEFFQTTLAIDAKVQIIDYDICIFERNSLWYTKLFNQNVWEETLLGKMNKVFLSCPLNIQYKTIDWMYFLKEGKDGIEVLHFVKEKLITFGKYITVKTNNNEKVFGLHETGLIDVITPNATSPLKGSPNTPFEDVFDVKGVYMPYLNEDKWRFHPNYQLLGKNAAYKITTINDEKIIELNRIICGEFKLFKVSSNFYFDAEPFCLVIDEMIYSYDTSAQLLNFDTPLPTLKKRIKNFFGIE